MYVCCLCSVLLFFVYCLRVGGVVVALGVFVGVLFLICFDACLSYCHCVGLLIGRCFISFVG